MADGAEALSKVSGLSRSEIVSIWEKVKENAKRLKECVGHHEFEPTAEDNTKGLFPRWKCKKCLGEVPDAEHRWYVRGLYDGMNAAAAKANGCRGGNFAYAIARQIREMAERLLQNERNPL